jgi:hypothetical protein
LLRQLEPLILHRWRNWYGCWRVVHWEVVVHGNQLLLRNIWSFLPPTY